MRTFDSLKKLWNTPWPERFQIKSTVLKILFVFLAIFFGYLMVNFYFWIVPSPWDYIFLPFFLLGSSLVFMVGRICVALIEEVFIRVFKIKIKVKPLPGKDLGIDYKEMKKWFDEKPDR
jgi:hypothetical protein